MSSPVPAVTPSAAATQFGETGSPQRTGLAPSAESRVTPRETLTAALIKRNDNGGGRASAVGAASDPSMGSSRRFRRNFYPKGDDAVPRLSGFATRDGFCGASPLATSSPQRFILRFDVVERSAMAETAPTPVRERKRSPNRLVVDDASGDGDNSCVLLSPAKMEGRCPSVARALRSRF